jgi:choline dehydrogenase-like flavoprotein
VDRDCRVHGLDNLFIASSSVFPTTGEATHRVPG